MYLLVGGRARSLSGQVYGAHVRLHAMGRDRSIIGPVTDACGRPSKAL